MMYVDYIFLNEGRFGHHTKTMVLSRSTPLEDYPMCEIVTFKNLSNNKEPKPEILLRPVASYRDPFRKGDNTMALCELEDESEKAVECNMRRPCKEILESVEDRELWFGLEQEYFLEDNRGDLAGWLANLRHLKFKDFYGGVGLTPTAAIEREIAEVHSRACFYAGIKFAGLNREDAPGQWEYQIGPCVGLAAADQLVLSRVLLDRVAEMYGFSVNYHPRPVNHCLPTSGLHINFSTKDMRSDGGIKYINEAMDRIASVDQTQLMECYDIRYGQENKERLTGDYYTPDASNFRAAVADKFASLRVPLLVAKKGCGRFEERRPASNCDIYTALAAFTKAALFGENYICPR
ncbi:hypothetical protein ScPMuIL_015592 [Solemya velum]